jgi:hypothetical protein
LDGCIFGLYTASKRSILIFYRWMTVSLHAVYHRAIQTNIRENPEILR